MWNHGKSIICELNSNYMCCVSYYIETYRFPLPCSCTSEETPRFYMLSAYIVEPSLSPATQKTGGFFGDRSSHLDSFAATEQWTRCFRPLEGGRRSHLNYHFVLQVEVDLIGHQMSQNLCRILRTGRQVTWPPRFWDFPEIQVSWWRIIVAVCFVYICRI